MSLKIICSLLLLSSIGFAHTPFRKVVRTPSFVLSRDIGGGSGRIRTPYVPGKPVLAKEMLRIKKISTRTRVVKDVPSEGTHVIRGGKDVGLAFVKGENVTGIPSFVFRGAKEDSVKTSIDLSEVLSFKVVQREDARVLIELVQFPAITPEELLSSNPSYSDLSEHNRKTVRLWVSTKLAGKDLCLVGKDENKRYQVIAKLNQISLNTDVDLDYGTFVFGDLNLSAIWWAIESVTRDSKYPYRIMVAA